MSEQNCCGNTKKRPLASSKSNPQIPPRKAAGYSPSFIQIHTHRGMKYIGLTPFPIFINIADTNIRNMYKAQRIMA